MSDKQTVVEEYRAAYGAFRSAVEGLNEAQLTAPFMENWSVREVVGHLAGWQDQLGMGLERMAQGQRPTPEGVDWNDVQGFNVRFAADVADKPVSELLRDLEAQTERFIAALEAIPADRFGEGKTANRMAAGAGFEHFREHAEEVTAARAEGKL